MKSASRAVTYDGFGAEGMSAVYRGLAYEAPSLQSFLGAIHRAIAAVVPLGPDTSFFDIGCGRGYWVRYLRDRGFPQAAGVEPCPDLRKAAVVEGIRDGSFEHTGMADASADVVVTCHTLHHLPDPWPRVAVGEMLRIARRAVVIIEVSNANLPMLLRALLLRRQERHCWRYNLRRVRALLAGQPCRVLASHALDSGYLSGGGRLHRLAARCGARPYCIAVAAPS